MALPNPSPYLQTNDVILAYNGDGTVTVQRPRVVTATATMSGALAILGACVPAYGTPYPRHRKRKKYPVTPERGVIKSKVKGSVRNQRCPKCGKKFKVCGHVPNGGGR